MILHTFNTWLVANLLHPVFIFLVFGSMKGEWFDGNIPGTYFFFLIFSILLSIPLLIIALVFFYFIEQANLSGVRKFGAWTFFVTVQPVVIGFLFLGLSVTKEALSEDLSLIIPSAFAGLAAVLIRYKQFFKLFNQANANINE